MYSILEPYYITKTESDSVAIIFVEQMLLMKKAGAAHRNTRDITVRCTFMVSFKSQSTNIWVRCTWYLEVILFDVRFKNRGDFLGKQKQTIGNRDDINKI